MKKSLIAAAGASLAVAAMPVVGVFAATDYSANFTDTVEVTVNQSCIFRNATSKAEIKGETAGRTFTKDNVQPGTLVTFSSAAGADVTVPAVELYCTQSGNAATGTYTISAEGAGTSGSETQMTGAAGSISTGTTFSGATSAWAYSIDGTNYSVIPSSTTQIKTDSITTGTAETFAPSYKVYVGTGQAAGTYTGKVKYTLSVSFQ